RARARPRAGSSSTSTRTPSAARRRASIVATGSSSSIMRTRSRVGTATGRASTCMGIPTRAENRSSRSRHQVAAGAPRTPTLGLLGPERQTQHEGRSVGAVVHRDRAAVRLAGEPAEVQAEAALAVGALGVLREQLIADLVRDLRPAVLDGELDR